MKHALVVAGLSAFAAASVATFLRLSPQGPAAVVDVRTAPLEQLHPKEVVGLWSRWPSASGEGDRVRFYFFHETGIGLYRHGKVGLNATSSFDWHVAPSSQGAELVMTFRKTGEVKRTKYELVEPGEGRWLTLSNDPKEPLVNLVSYTFVPPPGAALLAADLWPANPSSPVENTNADGRNIGGRMWIAQTAYATGGSAFSMYQLRGTGLDGCGIGWHHLGDFDDWSTEALSYCSTPASCKSDPRLDFTFSVRGERAMTPVVRKGNELLLVEDPRSFWHVRAYQDGGKSFSFVR